MPPVGARLQITGTDPNHPRGEHLQAPRGRWWSRCGKYDPAGDIHRNGYYPIGIAGKQSLLTESRDQLGRRSYADDMGWRRDDAVW